MTKFWNFYLIVFFMLIMTNVAFYKVIETDRYSDRDLYFLIGFIVCIFLIFGMIAIAIIQKNEDKKNQRNGKPSKGDKV
jgi:hypothetical protein